MNDIPAVCVKSQFRKYGVSFSGLSVLDALIKEKTVFVVGPHVWSLYSDQLKIIPKDRVIIINASERNKTFDSCRDLINILIEKNVQRDYKIVAIGGGVIQDIVSFTASILYRGIEWVFIPTTLLAMADSCIGGKTSINLYGKKNLIGSYHPPSSVYIDPEFLYTLSENEIKSGIGEILHFYLYAGSVWCRDLVMNYDQMIKDRKLLVRHIRESLLIKKSVVQKDEFDRGERRKFNYGHTFGHALESVTDYQIPHGLAVTVGMDMANYVSMKKGMIEEREFLRLHAVLQKNFPKYDLKTISLDQYFSFLAGDKKNTGNEISCILMRGIGRLEEVQLPADGWLRENISEYLSFWSGPRWWGSCPCEGCEQNVEDTRCEANNIQEGRLCQIDPPKCERKDVCLFHNPPRDRGDKPPDAIQDGEM